MPEIRFSADTHPELVRQVQVWLESTEAERTATDVVQASADLTKDALRIIAAAAPAPIAYTLSLPDALPISCGSRKSVV